MIDYLLHYRSDPIQHHLDVTIVLPFGRLALVLDFLYVEQWIYPDVDESGKLSELFDDVPAFTDSLDACFRWLVPKLQELKWKMRISAATLLGGTAQSSLTCWERKYNKQNRPHICVNAETPALALCLAVEKLIQKESDA